MSAAMLVPHAVDLSGLWLLAALVILIAVLASRSEARS